MDDSVRIDLGKVNDILKMGPPKAIDRLAVITHHHYIAMLPGNNIHDLRLKVVGILVFVYQQMKKLAGVSFGDLIVFGQQFPPIEKQVVKVHEVAFSFMLVVHFINLLDLFGLRLKLGIVARDDIGDLAAGIDGEAEQSCQAVSLGKTLRLGINAAVGDAVVDQVFSVRSVQDRKV